MLKAARELCPGCIIVGPAVSHEDYRAGWKWLRAFYVEALRIGVTLPEVSAIHTYLPGDPARIVDSHFALLAEFPGAATTAWVTEFATSSPAQARRMIDYYEADPRITRYAWFTAAGGAMTWYCLMRSDRQRRLVRRGLAPPTLDDVTEQNLC
jgi:hypothetical protein